ncbi:glycoside hydrolase family 88 protein [Neorhodopirellula lusitana]|nr:glycoside hydrolase family 88 protein [Neorhodopirellula lusitana]
MMRSSRRGVLMVSVLVPFIATLNMTSHASGAEAVYRGAASAQSPVFPVPSDKRIPFAWPSIAIAPASDGGSTHLQWLAKELPPGETIRLRLATALDSRQKLLLEVRLPGESEPLGHFDFNYAPVFQIGELTLTRGQAKRVLEEGVLITRTVGEAPFHLFGPDSRSSSLEDSSKRTSTTSSSERKAIPVLLQPHLMVAGETDRWAVYMERMEGIDTIQPFGWMEGALLDGVWDLGQVTKNEKLNEGFSSRMGLYLRGDQLIYEDPKSFPSDNRVCGIEDSLPFAAIARVHPEHPRIQLAIDFWKDHRRESGFAEGCIVDGGMCSAEGAYTVGYPLMHIGALRNDPQLVAMALDQFRIRQKLLVDEDGGIWLRNSNGRRSMKNWARGVTWYFLGLVRGIAEAPEGTDTRDLRSEAVRVMEHVLRHQQDNGLWRNLFDLPEQTVDTSGSAGIAAALAIGAAEGILPDRARLAAIRTKEGLSAYLTADGLLAHGTPSNRSPEAQSNRRVIFPVGMGLTAQLLAALEK